MLRAKSLTLNVVADVTGFPDLHINLVFLGLLIVILILISKLEILRVVRLLAAILWFCPPFLPFPYRMAKFIQLLRRQKTKTSNMLLVCSWLCYRLSR